MATTRPAITSRLSTTTMITMTRVVRESGAGASEPWLSRCPVSEPECSIGLTGVGRPADRLPYTVPCGRCWRAQFSYCPAAGPPEVGTAGDPLADSDGKAEVPPARGAPD